MTEVSYRSKLIQRALLVSHDADKLWKVFEDAMEHIRYVEAQRAFRDMEITKLKDKNERQTAMSYKQYTVKVYESGAKEWYLNGKRHREDGPAIERGNGEKYWYLNGKELTEQEFKDRMNNKNACDGKIVEIDGVKYQLTIVE